jgi:hypothetical protein
MRRADRRQSFKKYSTMSDDDTTRRDALTMINRNQRKTLSLSLSLSLCSFTALTHEMQRESHFFRSPEDERTILPRSSGRAEGLVGLAGLAVASREGGGGRKGERRREERVLRDSEGGGIPFGYVVCDPQRCAYVYLHGYSTPE